MFSWILPVLKTVIVLALESAVAEAAKGWVKKLIKKKR